MSLMDSLLEKSKQEKELLSFYIYGDDKFWCGYIIDYSEEFLVIQHFTKYGENDGIIIHPKNQIERIDFNDDYIKSMKYIIENKDIIRKSNEINIVYTKNENYILNVLKQLSGNNDVIVSFQISNKDFYTGYILEFSDVDFTLNCIGQDGDALGMVLLKIEDVTNIDLDDLDNRKRNVLYKLRKASV